MHEISYLREIIVLLLASIGIIIIFKQLGLSPVLGYLVAGTLIGPNGFGILENGESTQSIAELGIVFLLFAIGLELSFEKLKTMKKYIFGFGGLQIILTTLAISLAAYGLGIDAKLAIIIGSALALSSTAIVLQIINDNGDQTSKVGRLSLSVLILQDLAVIPILVLLPLLSNPEIGIASALGGALINTIIALVIIFIVGRLLLKPIFRIVVATKNDVLFLSTALLVILGSAFITDKLGLSLALGAFVAGLMVAETEYKYRVENEILSLKSLLMGLFFITIGMSFQFDLLVSKLPIIIIASIALIICKASIIIFLCKIFKFPLAPSIHTGLLLAQGGEFAFIVFIVAVQDKIMPLELSQLLMTIVTVTMAFTPLLSAVGKKIKGRIYMKDVLEDNKLGKAVGGISKHVIVIGFGRVGRVVGHFLKKRNENYLILSDDRHLVDAEKANGYNIYYGDALNIDILNYIGIKKAESVIVTMEDESACVKIIRFIKSNFPETLVITKSDTISNAARFKKFGADVVIIKNLETGLRLGRSSIKNNATDNEIKDVFEEFYDADSEFIQNILNSKSKL